jgi:hypothetical protein
MIRQERFLLKQLSLNTCDSDCTSPVSTPQSLLSSPNKSPQSIVEKVSQSHFINYQFLRNTKSLKLFYNHNMNSIY